MKIDKEQWKWTREPKAFSIEDDRIEIITKPYPNCTIVLRHSSNSFSINPYPLPKGISETVSALLFEHTYLEQ